MSDGIAPARCSDNSAETFNRRKHRGMVKISCLVLIHVGGSATMIELLPYVYCSITGRRVRPCHQSVLCLWEGSPWAPSAGGCGARRSSTYLAARRGHSSVHSSCTVSVSSCRTLPASENGRNVLRKVAACGFLNVARQGWGPHGQSMKRASLWQRGTRALSHLRASRDL